MFATYGAPLQNDISVEVLFSLVNRHPFVRAAFSLNRFSNLINYLRFDDKTARSAPCERGVFCPISDLWDAFNSKLAKHFVPGERNSDEEQPVPFRGR